MSHGFPYDHIAPGKFPNRLGRRSAFTLVELLVVIAIIGVLVALLLPAVQAAREAARRMSCVNNLKQIGLALHMYHDLNQTQPPGWMGLDPTTNQPQVEGQPGWGWASKILPMLEQANVQDRMINDTYSITDPMHDAARVHPLAGYRCRSDTGLATFFLHSAANPQQSVTQLATSNYVGVFGTIELEDFLGLPVGEIARSDGSFWHLEGARFADYLDGLSNTLVVGERSARYGYSTWTGAVPAGEEFLQRILGITDHPPNHPGAHLDDFTSEHPAGVNFLFGDGSVRLLVEEIDLGTYRAMATRAGSESLLDEG